MKERAAYLRVFSFLSSDLACCSLMMEIGRAHV